MKAIAPIESFEKDGFVIRAGDHFLSSDGYEIIVKGICVNREDDIDVLYYYAGSDPNRHQAWNIRSFIPNHNSGSGTRFYKLTQSMEDLTARAFEVVQSPEMLGDHETDVETTALATAMNQQEQVQRTRDLMEAKRQEILMMEAIIARKVAHMRAIREQMERQIKYMSRIIQLMETYIGIYEKILLIRDGEPAEVHEPLCIRQLILYADEEVGSIRVHHGNIQGINFQNIEEFDEWLLEDDHLDLIVPEKRSIVALKASRQKRTYSNDSLINFFIEDEHKKQNAMTYLIIRNGEKVYRIWTNFAMEDKLFPEADTYTELITRMNDAKQESEADRLRHEQLNLQQNAVLIEGLIARTDVFKPHVPGLTLFDDAVYAAGHIVLIRDAEGILGDGHLPYKEWHQQINAKIDSGSRIVLANLGWNRKEYEDRFAVTFQKRTPDLPKAGLYVVDECGDRALYPGDRPARYFKILYNPKDEIWTYSWRDGFDTHVRKNKIGFWLSPKDEVVLNYDQLTPEEVLFYINHRLERKHYLDMLPVLMRTYDQLMQERQYENHLIQLVANDLNVSEERVQQAVEWYKYRNTIKRSIAEDDSKAWRMIRRRASKERAQ